jgi:SAM-dependent methyltransferase
VRPHSSTDSALKPLYVRISRPLLRLSIRLEAALVDARFTHQQGLQRTNTSRLLALATLGSRRLRRELHEERQDLLYERYTRLHTVHYGPQGRGYSSVSSLTSEEKIDRYSNQVSRLENFLDKYPDLLQFNDGDSFLDWGCGTGQNIRMLAQRYPKARIVGYDLNQSALDLILECERHSLLQLGIGNLADAKFRKAALSEGFDHIVMSHVFSLIFCASLRETRILREAILNDLVSACRSTLVIIDVFGAPGPPEIRIEQRHRAIMWEEVLACFEKLDSGRAFMISNANLRAIVFLKKSEAINLK